MNICTHLTGDMLFAAIVAGGTFIFQTEGQTTCLGVAAEIFDFLTLIV